MGLFLPTNGFESTVNDDAESEFSVGPRQGFMACPGCSAKARAQEVPGERSGRMLKGQ
jgi:hypothetical protein